MLVHRQGIVSALVSFQKEAVGSEQPSERFARLRLVIEHDEDRGV